MKTFVALYLGTDTPEARAAVHDKELRAAGVAAWMKWGEEHAADIVDAGGPLGTTKRVAADGISDTRNAVTGYVIVRAETHEAAARMFEGHPHFSVFPGEAVEIMEILPVPGV